MAEADDPFLWLEDIESGAAAQRAYFVTLEYAFARATVRD